MNKLPVHPHQDQLIAFGMGKLAAEETNQIEKHLEGCPDCCETMLGLGDDTFVALVRRSPPPTARPEATLDLGSLPPVADAPVGELPRELQAHARYEILELIGRGGMGDVYRAQHKVMNRPVALKVIKPELVQNEAAVHRFHREVQAAARLHHDNIVTAYDAEQAGHLHFLVMEFVDGVSLDEVVRQRGQVSVAQACDYIRQAAAGLQHAHDLGMVHRDIKPHNLMLTAAGKVKILDFGLASFASEIAADEVSESLPGQAQSSTSAIHHLTQMGTMMGTPDYIAPEQAADAHTADIRADIYSLGCTFYALLAGRAPFGQGSVLEKIKAHTEQAPKSLSELRDDVPTDVEAVVFKMMAKTPAERYQSPAEVTEALARFIDQRIDEKLRQRGIGEPPIPLKPRAVGRDDARDWYDRLAGFMWSVACINLLGGIIMAGVIAWVMVAGGKYYHLFILHPLTLLVLCSFVPGALLLAVVPRVRRMESYGWTLFAAFLCLVPSVGSVLGFMVGCVALRYLLRSEYRVPLGVALRPTFREEVLFIAMLLCPFALTAAGVVFYISTDFGVVRVEVADESLQVRIEGQTISAQDRDTTVIRIRPGDRKLIITGKSFFEDDFEFQTDSFQLRRGDKVAFKVDILRGEVVVLRDGKRFDTELLPKSVASSDDAKGQAEPAASKVPSKFLETLGDLQAIVRKTLTEEGLTVRGMDSPANSNPTGPRSDLALSAEIVGEEGREGKLFSAITEKLKGLASSSDAFIGDLQLSRQGAIDRYHMTYSTPTREGTIKLERSLLGADKRMPAIRTWSLKVHLEEWPKVARGVASTDAATESNSTWTPLFNGRDLAGWKPHPDLPGNWRVEKGVLIGDDDRLKIDANTFLMTERNDYKDFHLRLEARVRFASADSGVNFDYTGKWDHFTEVNITFDPEKLPRQTGSIKVYGSDEDWIKTPPGMAFSNEWFTLEIIARDSHIMSKVNGRVASESHKRKPGSQGHILLQQRGGQTVVEFRKIEIIELDEYGKPLHQPTSPEAAPLTIGMNDDFGMLFQGRLVAPAELGRVLDEALKENPDREVVIDLPKKKWTVAPHVDQLEQIARIAGAKRITRPAWSEIRIVFGVINGSAQTLVIEGPAYSASGFLKSNLPNVREVIAKNPDLPVLLDVAEGVDLVDPKIAEGLDEIRRVVKEAGATIRE